MLSKCRTSDLDSVMLSGNQTTSIALIQATVLLFEDIPWESDPLGQYTL